ncbi:MAG: AmpG family muropeptide MFS transporter [Myxococcales bacterium]|nr:AmpG family muropeptide MFS transporter [Myxococcales bacterium]
MSRLLDFLRVLASRRMLVCLGTGFASGMPLYVLIQLLPAWFKDAGLDLASIGLFSLAMLPYSWKFVWAPLLDRYGLPGMGRRKSWAAGSQVALVVLLAALGALDPRTDTTLVAAVAAGIAFASATQDIALDALRREILADNELGLGNAVFVNAYRVSSLVPGSLALILADRYPWGAVHLVVAACMALGLATTAIAREPAEVTPRPATLDAAVREPFRAFHTAHGTRGALTILAFMRLYKLGDSMATALATAFYLDIGFTKTDVGTVAKVAALWASVGGGIAGGLIMLRVGIHRALWLFGAVQIVSILGFAALAEVGPDATWLFWVVSFEYLGVGLGTSAFVAYMASVTDSRYTATQLALLTSLTGLPRTLANASSGFLVEALGWTAFFLVCTAIALPGLAMLPWVAPWRSEEPA